MRSPLIDLRPRFLERKAPILIEAFVPQFPVEALNESVLRRLSWLDPSLTVVSLAQRNIALLVNAGPLSLTMMNGRSGDPLSFIPEIISELLGIQW